VQEVLMRRATSPQPGDQLDLFRPYPKTPQWAQLPPEARQQTVRLLAQLLRQHRRGLFTAAHEQEVRDE
jgi:acyl-CoA reductase-like NAD-dependent aldehyde dehydrogenase